MRQPANAELLRAAREHGITLYVCPVTGRLLVPSTKKDDKVICYCGHGNPSLPAPMQHIEVATHVHYVDGLKTA